MQTLPRPPLFSSRDLESVSNAFFDETHLETAAQSVAHLIGRRLRTAAVTLMAVGHNGTLRVAGTHADGGQLQSVVTDTGHDSLALQALRSGTPVVAAGVSPVRGPDAKGGNTLSAIAVPLVAGHERVGVLVLCRARPLEPRDLRVLRHIAHHVALGIRYAGVKARIAGQRSVGLDRPVAGSQAGLERGDLLLIDQVARRVSLSIDLDETLQLLTSTICDAIGADACLVAISHDRRWYGAAASNPYAPAWCTQGDAVDSSSTISQAILRRELLVVDELDPAVDRPLLAAGLAPSSSAIVAPLVLGRNVLGALIVVHDVPVSDDRRRRALVAAIAEWAVIALSNAERHSRIARELSDNVARLERAVTENRRLLAAAAEIRDLFDEVFHNLPSNILVIDAGTLQIEYANRRIGHYMQEPGRSGGFVGAELAAVISDPLRSALLATVRRVVETREPTRVAEYRVDSPGEASRYWTCSVAPLHYGNPNLKLVISMEDVSSDVLGRKRAQELAALADGERRRLHAVLENMPVGVVMTAPTGAISMLNREAVRLLDVSAVPGGMLGDGALASHVYTSDGEPLRVQDWPISRSLCGEVLDGCELEIRRPGEQPRALVVNSTPITDAEGTIIGAVAIFRDLAPIRQISALEALAQLKSEFIAGVSHELRTPLHYIKGYTSALLRRDQRVTPDELREFLEIIEHESDKLSHMIEDLLDTSRIEAGVVAVETRRMDLELTLRRVVERLRKTADAHAIVLDLPPELPTVEADPRRIEQVLTNLLENATKYSSPGTTIAVGATAGAGHVTVSVSDQGEGIPPEHVAHIFDRFYRVPNVRNIHGSGLGLFICRGLIEAHGGTIWVESRLGEGACFSFTLPYHPLRAPD